MGSDKHYSMQDWLTSSYLDGDNAIYLEQLYHQYQQDASSVAPDVAQLFEQINQGTSDVNHADIQAQFKTLANQPRQVSSSSPAQSQKQAAVCDLINAYRNYGHHQASLDPLGLAEKDYLQRLNLAYYGLENEIDSQFEVGAYHGLSGKQSLKEIQASLERTYCHHFAAEYMHITDTAEFEWLAKRIEENEARPVLTGEERKEILAQLTAAEGLEKYLGRRYVGQKRFSLEGGDSLIPCLHEVIERSFATPVQEIMIGMAHRGRLNVLVNILGKSPQDLFDEFEGKRQCTVSMGDVKYHNGFSSNLNKDGKQLHLSLAFNPSHLEIVDPVVQGAVRAKQRRIKDKKRERILPILIHGDAAFCGQGVVMETFAMSQVKGFKTGGTVHVVVNNQIGFTTDHPILCEAKHYCTDIAKMVQAPIFHVNGDDPEAVVFAAQIALDYRNRFKKDIVIDLVCYRQHGHNESDEPSATQPLMYQTIKKKPTPSKAYAAQLIDSGIVTKADVSAMIAGYQDALDQGKPVAGATHDLSGYQYAVNWKPFLNTNWRDTYKSGVAADKLRAYGDVLFSPPVDFTLQPQVKKVLADRRSMMTTGQGIDWGTAENLAYASLLDEGFPMRLCGQDSCRGTFAHRHAVFHDQKNGRQYMPLEHVCNNDASVIIINSILSEEGVLGFEYGFASAEPNNLVLWEAQFGDFVNGAQVVIDQFIAAGEQKWGRMCGLVMLLPHGYEGMGAEHSSARLERFLQLCAQENIQVCSPTTPAQIFHLIRRQMVRPYRKPLIVMTPKSLLRHKWVVSSIDELVNGQFELMIKDTELEDHSAVERVIVCSGKVYYDLLEQRREQVIKHIALVRIEQLYPFPGPELQRELASYSKATEVVWCQEEPMNQGAWYSIRHHLEECIAAGQALSYVGRGFASAPAVGMPAVHLQEQQQLIHDALTINQKK